MFLRRLRVSPRATPTNQTTKMKTALSYSEIRKILNSPELTDEQVARAFESASSDAELYLSESELPNVADMHLDWWIDEDLRDAGINDYGMQALSFAIVRIEQARAGS